MGERGLDRDLLEQTVLDRMRNKVKTLNTSPDNRGTFENRILEFRPGSTKFLLCYQAGDRREGSGFLRDSREQLNCVKIESACPTSKSSD